MNMQSLFRIAGIAGIISVVAFFLALALPAVLGSANSPLIMVFYAIYLSIWLWIAARHAPSAILYIAFALAAAQALWHYTLIRGRTREGCFVAFKQNHWLSATVFAGIALSFALRG